jgi:hypothetical protein
MRCLGRLSFAYALGKCQPFCLSLAPFPTSSSHDLPYLIYWSCSSRVKNNRPTSLEHIKLPLHNATLLLSLCKERSFVTLLLMVVFTNVSHQGHMPSAWWYSLLYQWLFISSLHFGVLPWQVLQTQESITARWCHCEILPCQMKRCQIHMT